MKKALLFAFILFTIYQSFAQVNYGSCQVTTSGSPCFFGLYSFYIQSVSFGTLNFSGGDCSGDGSDDGYQNKYNTDSGKVTQGATYTFTVNRSVPFFGNTGGFFSAWVDWNNDADFIDAGELLFTVSGSIGSATQFFSVTVPVNAVAGAHRLRVRTDVSDPAGTPNACSPSSYADTKDFKLIVEGSAPTCSVTIHTPWDNGATPACLYGCSATLSAEPNGAGPFSYSWSPVIDNDSLITNACAGTYSVTMTDNNGCSSTASVTISQPDSIHVIATEKDIESHCGFVSKGYVHISSILGGTGPYDFMWSTSATTQHMDSITDPDSYCFHVTDGSSCSLDTCFQVSSVIIPPPALQVEIINPTCGICSDGSAIAHVSGGVPYYYYYWYPQLSTDSILSGLAAGAYSVCIIDYGGCEVCDTVTLVAPCAVKIHTPWDNGADPGCIAGCSALLTAEPTGAGPFTYSWAPVVDNDSVLTHACAGSYTVTMTDNNGCTATDTVSIHQPDSLVIHAVVQQLQVHCDSLLPGFIHIINIDGGLAPHAYSWNTGATTMNLDSITTPGNYCITITDLTGCSLDACFDIFPPPPPAQLALQFDIHYPTGNGNDGSITAHASGGLAPYTFTWSPDVSNDSIALNLSEGVYHVCATDFNGCEVCDSVILIPTMLNKELAGNLIRISPNPAGKQLRIRLGELSIDKVEIYNMLGAVLIEENGNQGKELTVNVKDLPPGIYFVRVISEKGRWVKRFMKE